MQNLWLSKGTLTVSDKETTLYDMIVALTLGHGLPAIPAISGAMFLGSLASPFLSCLYHLSPIVVVVIHSWMG